MSSQWYLVLSVPSVKFLKIVTAKCVFGYCSSTIGLLYINKINHLIGYDLTCNVERRPILQMWNTHNFGLENATALVWGLKCSLICVDHDELVISNLFVPRTSAWVTVLGHKCQFIII